jgi:pSer/pThr/pTyr-binding forkhead associated (FHA) protein
MSILVFQLGEGNELEAELAGDIVTLGRAGDNDIVIENAWISWHHARFERTGHSFRVVDLNSHNGILLNDTRITEAALSSGDVLTFGQLQVVFRDSGTGPTPPSAGRVGPRAAATVPLVPGAARPLAAKTPRPHPAPSVPVPPPRPKPAP